MGRADLEWEFTSFSKEWGDQVRTDPAVFFLLSEKRHDIWLSLTLVRHCEKT